MFLREQRAPALRARARSRGARGGRGGGIVLMRKQRARAYVRAHVRARIKQRVRTCISLFSPLPPPSAHSPPPPAPEKGMEAGAAGDRNRGV